MACSSILQNGSVNFHCFNIGHVHKSAGPVWSSDSSQTKVFRGLADKTNPNIAYAGAEMFLQSNLISGTDQFGWWEVFYPFSPIHCYERCICITAVQKDILVNSALKFACWIFVWESHFQTRDDLEQVSPRRPPTLNVNEILLVVSSWNCLAVETPYTWHRLGRTVKSLFEMCWGLGLRGSLINHCLLTKENNA